MRRPLPLLVLVPALLLSGCAQIPETITWEEWATDAVGAENLADLYSGQAVGGYLGDGVQSSVIADTFSNVSRGRSTLDLYCRSTEPVVFAVDGAEPVTVDCSEGGSVEVELEASTRVTPSSEGRIFWLAFVRTPADAFVDGEPVEP